MRSRIRQSIYWQNLSSIPLYIIADRLIAHCFKQWIIHLKIHPKLRSIHIIWLQYSDQHHSAYKRSLSHCDYWYAVACSNVGQKTPRNRDRLFSSLWVRAQTRMPPLNGQPLQCFRSSSLWRTVQTFFSCIHGLGRAVPFGKRILWYESFIGQLAHWCQWYINGAI